MKNSSLFEITSENKNKSTDEILLLIEERVSELMSSNPDLLFSHLYRLDVKEDSIKTALGSDKPIHNLAGIILRRQLKRMDSKKKFSNSKSKPEDENLEW